MMLEKLRSELPWAEKYRPAVMSDIISNQYIIKSLKQFIKLNTLPHLLFYGPSGCGKTSTIKCCVKKIYGKHARAMILELNASNDRGIEIVRTLILGFISSGTVCSYPHENPNSFKMVILDEFDSMTADAQGMLRRIIEQNSNRVRFCLICNDIEKVTPAIKSRCAIYQFMPLKAKDMKDRLIEISNKEKITIDDDAINGIINVSNSDMRTAINTLHYVYQINKTIDADTVYRATGNLTPSMSKKLFKMMQGGNLSSTVKEVYAIICETNITMSNFLECLRQQIVMNNHPKKLYIIIKLAELEIGDALTVHPFITIAGIVSLFKA